jgi:hypothetical protein
MALNKRQIQTKALMLCGRWLRVSRRGIALGSSCGCNFDVAIESGQLDELLLDHYIDLFSRHVNDKFYCIESNNYRNQNQNQRNNKTKSFCTGDN